MINLSQHFINFESNTKTLYLKDGWTLKNINVLKQIIGKLKFPFSDFLIINGENIKQMDSAGAWLISQWLHELKKQIDDIKLEKFSAAHQKLLILIEPKTKKKPIQLRKKMLNGVARIGKDFLDASHELQKYFQFIGEVTIDALRTLVSPHYIRWRTFFSTIDKAGFQALPIIALMSLMIGIVIAYQSGLQLKKFGASLLIVDLMGYSILREFGPLITAIMVAGRTGSAFTAQLGLMKVNQEIDALNTMGVTSTELLVLPRIAGLVITLPLLTIWADIFGVLGGMWSAINILNIDWLEFLNRFQREVPLKTLIIGLCKAPIFALIIATVGCFQGMSVQRNAESVGLLTTRSVVLSIFFIIVADSIFAVVLNIFKL